MMCYQHRMARLYHECAVQAWLCARQGCICVTTYIHDAWCWVVGLNVVDADWGTVMARGYVWVGGARVSGWMEEEGTCGRGALVIADK